MAPSFSLKPDLPYAYTVGIIIIVGKSRMHVSVNASYFGLNNMLVTNYSKNRPEFDSYLTFVLEKTGRR